MKFNLEELLAKQTKTDSNDDFPEDRKRFTDDKRTEARLLAIQAVFMFLNSEERTVSGVINESIEFAGLKSAQLDKKLFSKIAEKAIKDKDIIIEEIEKHLDESWSFQRLEKVTSAVLISAIAELIMKETAPQILISEYMALSHAFLEEKEAAFIHGVLAKVIQTYNLGE